jgi:hypothetical protein
MDPKEARKLKAKEVIQTIQYYATQIYEALEPGMVMTVVIPNSKLVVPNQPQSPGSLIIIKPAVSVKVMPT